MAKGPATEGRLGDLHNKIAEVMISALDQIEKAQEVYEQTDPEVLAEQGRKEPEISAPLLAVMVRFLDANKVTCAPEEGNTMSDLQKKLAEKRASRRTVGNVVHAFDND